MRRKKGIKRLLAFVLALCMVVTGVFTTNSSAAQVQAEESTTVYFLNSNKWAEVGAYTYSPELLGGWPGTTAEAAPEVGADWMKVTINGTPPCSIKFYNKANDKEGSELWLSDASKLYVTADSNAHTTKEAAEASLKTTGTTKVYFYNSDNYESVTVHAWNDAGNLTGDFGNTKATTSELGEGWLEVEVPAEPTFHLIFADGADTTETRRITVDITDASKVYVSLRGKYTTKEAAEASLKTTGTTKVYFYNSDNYESVTAHAWNDAGDLTGSWGNTKATTSELGEGWLEVEVPAEPTFHLIFADGADTTETRRITVDITDTRKVYVSLRGKYATQAEAESAMGIAPEPPAASTTVYFLNSSKWAEVGAYTYSPELLGGWPGTTAEAAPEVGADWMKVTINGTPPCSIKFYNKANDKEGSELWLSDASKLYVALNSTAYATKEAAEASLGTAGTTKVYFYNSDNYEGVTVHAWNDAGDLTGSWGNTKATTSELGEGWLEVEVPSDPAFHLIFADSADTTETRRIAVDITDAGNVYVSLQGKYTSKEAAEASVSGEESEITRVWFYNIYGYETVKAHGWNTSGDLFATQPLVTRESMDSNWYYLDVAAKPPFNIQFIGESGDMQQGYVQGNSVYLAATDTFFSSKKAVEDYMNNHSTTVYFLNYNGDTTPYTKVYAYPYAGETAVGDVKWPGIQAEVSDIGEHWWKVDVPVNALLKPFSLIINDGNGNQIKDVVINNYKDNYITLKGDGTVYTAQDSAEISAGIRVESVVYLLNNQGWENTGVYIYGRPGEVLGKWPGGTPEAATELGEKWQKITVPAKTPFNIVYFNLDKQSERTEMLLSSEYSLYVTGSGAAYGSQFEAEAACGMVDPSELAVVYFYNSRGWGDIKAYTYKIVGDEEPALGASWPGTAAEKAPEIGENWWKATIPMRAKDVSKDNAFGVIFNDGVNQMPIGCIITDMTKVYTIATEEAFATPEEAEEAAANDDYDDGCEEGPNTDLDNYAAVYSGAGADLPYITYEAETANTNGEVLEKSTAYREAIQSEASGRQAVMLDATGEYVEFTLSEPANALVLRYSIPDTADGLGQDASLSCYINGAEKQNLELTSRYAWLYGSFPFFNTPKDGGPHRYYDEIRVLFDEVMPAGTKIKLQKDADDTAANYVIDFIETEIVAAPLAQPENSLSVTEFGAVANDGVDDRAAFEACIAAAKAQGKEVWIPAGNFDLVEKKFFTVSGVTIRGAGMWYSNLNGAGAAFKYYGTAKFYDFAMTGVSTVRDDSGDLAGIEGNGSRATNVTIENIWMEHMKVGVWSCNSENLVIQGCRIRNTFADGINLCSGTHNAVVRNNNLRNTGDDAIASWPWLANCTGNTIAHNTIQVPTLANGVAIYGGGEFVVDSNYVADTICNGAGVVVGSEFETPKSFTGTVTVKNNVLERCGSMQVDEGYPIGAIWIWSSTRFPNNNMNATFNVFKNVMNDCAQTGITIECGNDLTGVNIQNNTINGATNAVHEYYPGGPGTGSGKIGNLTTSNLSGDVHKDDAPNFTLEWTDEVIKDDTPDEGGDNGADGTPSEEEKYKDNVKLPNEGINVPKFSELVKAVFSKYELERMDAGVNMYVKVEKKEIQIPQEEKEAIDEKLGDMKLGTAFDIDIFKVINEREFPVTELREGKEIEIVLEVPEQYRNKNLTFSIIRVHNGEPTVLLDCDDNPDTITFKTNVFSTYVLAYQEQAGGNTGNDGNTGNGGNTGNDGNTGNGGNTGNDGNDGNTGNTGNDGGTGNGGNTGNDGNTGNSGNTGNTGNGGNTNAGGNTGSTGNAGANAADISYEKSPKTGDSNVIVWACMALAVGAVLLGSYDKIFRNKENE